MSRLAETVETLFVPLFALVVSAVVLAAFVAANGADPLGVFQTLYRGGFGTWFSFQSTLQRAAPLMLTALCTALPARLGLIVIGGEGALVIGGLAAAVAALLLPGASPITVSIAMALAAALSGGVWIGLVGGLRHYRGINGTIASLLFNYLAIAAIREKALGPEHPDVAASFNNLAGLYGAQGQYAKAGPLYHRALRILEATLPSDHPHLAQTIESYAALLGRLSRDDEAKAWQAKADAARERNGTSPGAE
ncbi:MAG: tetratricopeptide repeat protein [Gammaproteobacteria bacterium]